jgi:cytochrome bd-type quinol oxidase subunit 2
MLKTIINRIMITMVLMGGMLAPLAPATVYAQTKDDICEGVAITGGNCDPASAGTSVESVVRTVINLLSLIVGIVAVIMIIIGGLKYITSSGDSANVSSAKNTILYAIIGLVVVALAQVIVRFVLNKVG